MRRISALIALLFTLTSNCQVIDWITDQIRSEIDSEISKITNFNSNTLGSFGSYIWDAIVEGMCENDLKEKAKEFEKFHINDSYLNNLSKKYPYPDRNWTQYSEISSTLLNRANSYFHNTKSEKLNLIADSKIDKHAEIYVDSISSLLQIESLESALNSSALDSLILFSHQTGIRDSLLMDISNNPSIALALNNHPQAVRVYANTLNAPSLRKDTKHLIFWATKADSHRQFLPKKQRLINPRNLVFSGTDPVINIFDGNNIVASISNDALNVIDINIMNLLGRPNTDYIFEGNRWETDKYGRVIKASQLCEKSRKKKCKQKSTVKPKDLKDILGNENSKELAYIISPDFGAPEVLLNTYFYQNDKENKKAIKDIKKHLNTTLKKQHTFSSFTILEYENNSYIPETVLAEDLYYIESPTSEILVATTYPESKSFIGSENKAKRQPKTVFFNYSSKNSSTSKNAPQPTTKKEEIKSSNPKLDKGADQNKGINGKYTLKGKIDGKYPVTMTLLINGGTVSGTYYYDKYHIVMKINGNITDSKNMKLIEYDGNKRTGEYNGEFNGYLYKGEFVNYASGKRMPFSLTVQ